MTMRVRTRSILTATLAVSVWLASTAHSLAVSDVVISQAWGGSAGDTGIAVLPKADYIELFNRSAVPVNLSGWSIHIDAPAEATWRKHNLTDAVIPPHSYYLIRVSPNSSMGIDLPEPDTVFSTPIYAELTAASGKIVLRSNTTPFGSIICPIGDPTVIDILIYGTNGFCIEGSGRAPVGTALGNGLAIFRVDGGCTDTDNNAADFVAAIPQPRNSATPSPGGCTSGACCHDSNGTCLTVLGPGLCPVGSTYLGNGTVCSPNPCPPTGSCCSDCVFTCTVTTQFACGPGYTWTESNVCSPNPCITAAPPANDFACNAIPLTLGVSLVGQLGTATMEGDAIDPSCLTLVGKGVWYSFQPPSTGYYSISTCGATFDDVLTVFAGECFNIGGLVEQACDDDGCLALPSAPPVCGAAAHRSSSSIPIVHLEQATTYLIRVQALSRISVGGTFPIVVSATSAGACCNLLTGVCTVTPSGACTLSYSGNGTTCPLDPCNASGACCSGSTCVVAAPLGCTGPNALFAGSGTTCNFPGVNNWPCCLADHNHVGGVTVQDIFDFLASYFSGRAQADINGAGGVTVQDIFDFLAAYFAGGC